MWTLETSRTSGGGLSFCWCGRADTTYSPETAAKNEAYRYKLLSEKRGLPLSGQLPDFMISQKSRHFRSLFFEDVRYVFSIDSPWQFLAQVWRWCETHRAHKNVLHRTDGK